MRIILLALAMTFAATATAHACSCIGTGDPREEVAEADAAVYGKVVGRKVRDRDKRVTGEETVRYRLKVIRDYKDNLGSHVRLRAMSLLSPACGLDLRRGQRIATLLHRFRGALRTSLCSIRTRAHLERGTKPLPKPAGEPPTTLLLGGAFGEPRVFGLDTAGRVVGYGSGQGTVVRLAPCPGGDVVVELVLTGRGVAVAARTVAGFAVADTVKLRARRFVEDVECLSEDGRQVAVLNETGRLIVVDGDDQRTLATGLRAATLDGGRAWSRETVIDLRTGSSRPFGPLAERSAPLALSPDSKTLAVGGRRKELLLVDADTGRTVQARHPSYGYEAIWLSDEALVVSSFRRQRFFDRDLAEARKSSRLFGPRTADDGELVVARGDQLVRFDAAGRRVGAPVPLFTSAVQALCATR